MQRRKPIIVTAFLCLALFLTAAAAAGTAPDQSNGIAQKARMVSKLAFPLNKLAELYRTVPKLTPEMFGAILPGSRAAIENRRFVKKTSGNVIPWRPNQGTKGTPWRDEFLDPDLQKKWGGPGCDVYKCFVVYTGDQDNLNQSGIDLHVTSAFEYKGKKVARVEVAATDLEKLGKLPQVNKVSLIPRNVPNNDLGAMATGAARLRLGTVGNWEKGYTGKGVIVGDIDSGIDWTHEDFIDPNTNSSRILYLWYTGMTTPGKTPAALFAGDMSDLDYGTVYTREDIDNGLVPAGARDTNGHGTHTAGTAAGNGHATGQYTGMAPEAGIIFVRGLDDNGNVFIYELAKRLGKPCSVNMSYGPSAPIHYMSQYTEYYPGDGTDESSLWFAGLNEYYGGGHIPVHSNGNMGTWASYTSSPTIPFTEGGWHAGGTLGQTRTYTLHMADYYEVFDNVWGTGAGGSTYRPYYLNSTHYDYPEVQLGFWYDGNVRVTLQAPNGETFGPFTQGDSGEVSTNDSAYLWVEMDYAAASNGSYYGQIGLQGNDDIVPYEGDWTVTVEPVTPGGGYCDMWVSDWDWWSGNGGDIAWIDRSVIYSAFRSASPYEHMSMYTNNETASDFTLSVGSYNTREDWLSVNGGTYSWTTRPILNHIAESSSPGPNRLRNMKPDIAAPGNIILSALSQYCSTSTSPVLPLITSDGRHQAMSGTSMACPHVTGGVALILQKYKDLNRPYPDVNGMRDIIQSWAKTDYWTSYYGPNGFGAGKFNILPLNERPVTRVTVDTPKIDLTHIATATLDASSSSDYEKFPLNFTWRVISAPAGAIYTFTPYDNGVRAHLLPDGAVPGRYEIGVKSHDGIYAGNEAVAVVDVAEPADIAVTKTAAFNVALLNSSFVYTITARNLGPNQAANLSISDFLAASLSFVSASASQGGYNAASGIWTVGTLANGASATLQLTVKPTLEGTVGNTAAVYSVTALDANSANDSSSVTITVNSVYPPANIALQRLENDMIFYKEIVNQLTWQADSRNTSAITKTRVYRKAKGTADTGYQLLGEVNAPATQYLDRGLKQTDLYTYRVTSVNTLGQESMPVVVSN